MRKPQPHNATYGKIGGQSTNTPTHRLHLYTSSLKTTYCTIFSSHMVPLKHAWSTTPTTNTQLIPSPHIFIALERHTHTFWCHPSGLKATLKRAFQEGIKNIGAVRFSISTLTQPTSLQRVRLWTQLADARVPLIAGCDLDTGVNASESALQANY